MWWEYAIVIGGLALAVGYAIMFARNVFSEGDGCGCGHGACETNHDTEDATDQRVKVTPLVELNVPENSKQ